MKYLQKNMCIKSLLCIIIFEVLFATMITLYKQEHFTVFVTGWGGLPMISVTHRIGFLLCCLLIQYISIDGILFFLKNTASITIRYKSKQLLYYIFLENIVLNLLVFILFSGGLAILGYTILDQSQEIISFSSTLHFLFKVWLFCIILAQIQACLILTQEQAKAFLFFMLICYLLSILSNYKICRWFILPTADVPMGDYAASRLIVIVALTAATIKIIKQKEIT